jgi:hypothetical protein
MPNFCKVETVFSKVAALERYSLTRKNFPLGVDEGKGFSP